MFLCSSVRLAIGLCAYVQNTTNWLLLDIAGEIQVSFTQATFFKDAISSECRHAKGRVEAAELTFRESSEFVRTKKRQLLAVRRDILIRLAEDNQNAPPLYRSNSDTGGFCTHLTNSSDVRATTSGLSDPPPPAYDATFS